MVMPVWFLLLAQPNYQTLIDYYFTENGVVIARSKAARFR
jgi:hypothetical protein